MQCIHQARQLPGDFAHKRACEADNESPNGTWSRKTGPGAETCKPAVVAHICRRDDGGHADGDGKRKGQDSFREKLQDPSIHLYPDGRNRRKV